MKRSNRLVILVGLLLAVLAFVAIIIVLNGKGPENNPATLKVNVLVAKSDIAIGAAVTPDLVEVKQVAPEAVVATRIPDPSQLTGRPALYAIPAGTQVTAEAVGLVGTRNCVSCLLNAGEKAIAIQVDRVTGLDFLLQPGDHIDIVLAQDVQPVQETQDSITARAANPKLQPRYELVNGLNNVRTVKTILQDRRVLYVSATRVQAAQTGTNASPTPAPAGQQAQQQQFEVVIIVFAGSDQDAELIKFAQSNLGEQGALTAILRTTDDPDHSVKTTGVTLDGLIKQYGVPIPNIVVLPPQSPKP